MGPLGFFLSQNVWIENKSFWFYPQVLFSRQEKFAILSMN